MIDDPVTFEVLKNALVSCAREMSNALRRTAFSPNIKERMDCSCALFDTEGRLVAQSKDIPVHLGAMPLSVRACIDTLRDRLVEGTMALVNDPYSGGSHLPDLTLIAPVYYRGCLIGYVANRAHHADVGGSSPGSMPGISTSIEEEGVIIRPRIVVRDGMLDTDTITDLMQSTRTPDERLGDLTAQLAANKTGMRRLIEIASVHGTQTLTNTFRDLISYSAYMMSKELSRTGDCEAQFTDFMESDGTGIWHIPIRVRVRIANGRALISFDGTARQVRGNINCPYASTLSAVYYVFISLFGRHVPTNEGCWSVLDIDVPQGSLLNPHYPAAVAAGNVETTQRIVDAILGAMAQIVPDVVPAASQGTMNNLAIGGIDHRKSRPFTFYETIGGGAGAARGRMGTSGIHSHMTNTLNTPVEALEIAYPLRVRKYSLRPHSGGNGEFRGGDGIIREIEILSDECTVSIQSERRVERPWGLEGGEDGLCGKNCIIVDGRTYQIQSKSSVTVPAGTVVRIETPGGGGWGRSSPSEH